MTLGARLRARIAAEGPITFAAFMEAALYDEQDGFYARGPALGLGGQFSTAPTRHPKFAEAVAAELRELGGGATYVEVGPGDGTLAAAMPAGTDVVLVERAAGMRARQAAKVPHARFVDRPEDAGVAHGLVVANELFDALAVHLLDGADELLVADAGDRFTWARRPAPPELLALRGDTTGLCAVCPALEPMLASLAQAIGHGRLLVVDYGTDGPAAGPSPIRTYVGGRAGGEVLQAPGTQDLTADVDFARLRAAAGALGLRELGYLPQVAWLRARTLRPLAGTEAWYVERALEELPFQVLRLEKPPTGG